MYPLDNIYSVFPGLHDGWLRLYQDQHGKGGCQRHPGRGPGHVPRHQGVSRSHRLQGRVQARRRNQVSHRNVQMTVTVISFYPQKEVLSLLTFRTAKDAMNWLILIKEELGDSWLNNNMFRIGASGLLLDIERQLFHWVTGRYAAAHELAMS